jgi:hypothetical protein
MSSPLVQRLRPFTETIFAEMSALATRTGAINLGQGFPDTDGPASMLDIARDSIAAGVNQYPPGPGIPALRQAISTSRAADHGQQVVSVGLDAPHGHPGVRRPPLQGGERVRAGIDDRDAMTECGQRNGEAARPAARVHDVERPHRQNRPEHLPDHRGSYRLACRAPAAAVLAC